MLILPFTGTTGEPGPVAEWSPSGTARRVRFEEIDGERFHWDGLLRGLSQRRDAAKPNSGDMPED